MSVPSGHNPEVSDARTSTPVRTVFMGTPNFAVPILQALLAAPDFQVIAVVTQPDAACGRGRRLQPSAVKRFAVSAGLPVVAWARAKHAAAQEEFAALCPQLAVVAAYGQILPQSMLAVPHWGCINVHASLLPRYRGASPVAACILAGDKQTGVSLMQMDVGCDTGSVFAQARLCVPPDVRTDALTDSLAALGAKLVREALPQVIRGELTACAQDNSAASYAPLLRKSSGMVCPQRLTALQIDRHVRAMHPWPGAFGFCAGKRVRVLCGQSGVLPASQRKPGTLLAPSSSTGPVGLVCCDGSVFAIRQVVPAGKAPMDAAAWWRGQEGKVTSDSVQQVILWSEQGFS